MWCVIVITENVRVEPIGVNVVGVSEYTSTSCDVKLLTQMAVSTGKLKKFSCVKCAQGNGIRRETLLTHNICSGTFFARWAMAGKLSCGNDTVREVEPSTNPYKRCQTSS